MSHKPLSAAALLALAAPLTVLGAALLPAAAHAGLVVRSVGKGTAAFPVGRTVSPGTPIQLAPGDMLTILEGQSTRTFRGPGTFDLGRAAAATTTMASAATALNSRAAERKPRLGTVRGVPAIDAPSLWDIDLDQPGATQCVVDPATLMLRRKETTAARTLTITPAKGSATTLTLAPGTAAANWPKALAKPGPYTLQSAGQSHRLTLTKIPAPSGDAPTDAQALIKAGCTQQLDRFIATLEK
jgi:hypothetical protein